MSILTLNEISYQYSNTDKMVLNNISVSFEQGKVYAIIGQSGAGKSTLLSLISGLDVVTEGSIQYLDKDLKKIDRDIYRGKDIGVIFQEYNLIKNATALENLILSMHISGVCEKDMKESAMELLNKVGITSEDARRKVLKLSGGEQQRVAIARALAHNPEIIIADEPTGNLDLNNQKLIVDILKRLAYEENKCIIIVTHSKSVANCADIVYRIAGGKICDC